jgi:hypothetical protein
MANPMCVVDSKNAAGVIRCLLAIGVAIPLVACEESETTIHNEGGGGDEEGAEGPRILGVLSASNKTVQISYSRPMDASAVDPANYLVVQENVNPEAGGLILVSALFLGPDASTVELTTLSQNGILYRLVAGDVRDAEGTPLSEGDPEVDPAVRLFQGTPPGSGDLVDVDGDGVTDNVEQMGWIVTVGLANGQDAARGVSSDPRVADTDGDGLDDGEELRRVIDPREADTDFDGLTDLEEATVHFSNPVLVDSDAEGLDDGSEVRVHATSAILADTDGDALTDRAEIFELFSSPLIASVPGASVEFVGDAELGLDVAFTDGSSFSTSDGTVLTRGVLSRFSTTEATVNMAAVERSAAINAGFQLAASPKLNGGAELGRVKGYLHEHSFGWTQASQQAVQLEFDRLQAQARSRTEAAASGTLGMGIRVTNTDALGFTLTSLLVAVRQRDPVVRSGFATLAMLDLDALLGDGLALEPFGGQTGLLRIADDAADAVLVRDLLARPTGLVLEVETLDLVDARGRDLAFLSGVTSARTALITIDDESGKVRRFRVATSTRRNPDGTAAGITMREALEDVLDIDYATTIGDAFSDVDGDGTVDNGEVVREVVLSRIGSVANAPQARKLWVVLGSRPELVAPGLGFNSIVLRGGDSVFLGYVSDLDGDGLAAREEFLHGTDDALADTDGDGLSDFDEVKVGWDVNTDEERRAYSDPLSADRDRDGLSDVEERNGGTDPSDGDTDADGLCDGPGIPGVSGICGPSNRDPDPLEPALTGPPRIVALQPAPNAIARSPSAPIEIVLDQKLLADSSFTVRGSLTGLRFGILGFGATTESLVLLPFLPFLAGEEMEITLDEHIRNIDAFAFDHDPSTAALDPFVYRALAPAAAPGLSGGLDAPRRTVAWQDGAAAGENADLATGDFDRDGRIDVAVTDPDRGTVNVLFGLGSGGFEPPRPFAVGASPGRIAAGDLDEDGDLDLAVANRAGDEVVVLFHVGARTFVRFGGSNPAGIDPSGLALADFQGDGAVDLAVVAEGSSTLSIMRNRADLTFDVPVVYSLSNPPQGVGVGDLDGDGDVDVVVTSGKHSDGVTDPVGSLEIFFNDGAGAFASTADIPVVEVPSAVQVVDFDRDGLVDIAANLDTFDGSAGNGSAVVVLLNDLARPGSFLPAVEYGVQLGGRSSNGLVAADVDGDADLDLVSANAESSSVRVLENRGNGAFETPVAFDPGALPVFVRSADVDGDGARDLVLSTRNNEGGASRNGGITALVNSGAPGGFDFDVPAPFLGGSEAPHLATGDFDADGDVDAASVSSAGANLTVFSGLGNGTFLVSRNDDSTFAFTSHVAAADLDDNGRPDLVVTSAGGGAQDLLAFVLRNRGNGTFVDPTGFRVGPANAFACFVAAGDLDGDGDVDLAFASAGNAPAGNQASLLLNAGNGSFGSSLDFDVPAVPSQIAAGDMDGDGTLDLVLASLAPDVRAYLNQGGGGVPSFAPAEVVPTTDAARSIALGDFDRDFDRDLALGFSLAARGGIAVFENLGTAGGVWGGLDGGTAYLLDSDGETLAAGDMDGDGDPDLLAGQGGDLTALFNESGGSFPRSERFAAGTNASSRDVGLRDVDGDGDLDALIFVQGGLAVVANRAP